jgi:hypothetical protein
VNENRQTPASPRDRNQEPAAREADLIRAASTHPARLAEELRHRGGVSATLLDYLSHHPERRFRYLPAIRGYGLVYDRDAASGGGTAEKSGEDSTIPFDTAR